MRPSKQRHKNANSDSRKTNHCKMSITNLSRFIQRIEFAFYQILSLNKPKKRYTFLKKKIIPTLQYSISLAKLFYHIKVILSSNYKNIDIFLFTHFNQNILYLLKKMYFYGIMYLIIKCLAWLI